MSASAPRENDLLRRVRELEDERAVLRTLHRYAHALYDGDRDKFLDCFQPDAEMIRGRHGRAVVGHRELAEFFDAVTHAPQAYHKHVLVDPVVDVDGDRATASSDFLYVQDRGGPMISHYGHYDDQLVRAVDGVWRLSRRLTTTEAVAPGDVATIEGSPGRRIQTSEGG